MASPTTVIFRRSQVSLLPINCRILVDAGAQPVFAFSLGTQVDGETTIGGVNRAHYTGDFVSTILESTSYLMTVVALYPGNQVDGGVTVGGVDSAHHTATVDYQVPQRRGRVPLRQAWAPPRAPLP